MAKKTEPKTKTPKLLSVFEEDLVWMSYRYAIGRSTIAADGHAKNLTSYLPGKLTQSRSEFMAFDIRREIDTILASRYNFYIPTQLQCVHNEGAYNPLKIFNEFLKTLTKWSDMNKIKSVMVNVYGNYQIEYYKDENENQYKNRHTYFYTLNDLVVWENLASVLDTKHHKTFKLKDPDSGEIQLVTCFPGFYPVYGGEFVLEEVWIPLDRYTKNPYIQTRINPDTIVE